MSPRPIETRAMARAHRTTPKAARHPPSRDDQSGDCCPGARRDHRRRIGRDGHTDARTDGSTTHGRAPLLESPGCYELDADMTRMTPMAAAASCSGSLLVAATEIETWECAPRLRHAQPARSSQAPRSVPKCLNPPRLKNDPKSSCSVRITVYGVDRNGSLAAYTDRCSPFRSLVCATRAG